MANSKEKKKKANKKEEQEGKFKRKEKESELKKKKKKANSEEKKKKANSRPHQCCHSLGISSSYLPTSLPHTRYQPTNSSS